MKQRLSGKIATAAYNTMVALSPLENYKSTSGLWWKAWKKSNRLFSGPVQTTIHGYKATVNYGNTYPITQRWHPTYNNPLIELVYQSFCAKQRPITIIDVGAATGDTIMLLYSNCPDMIKDFFCVDGDPEFFQYLQANLSKFSGGHFLNAMLSASEGQERELVRTHQATASAQGSQFISAVTLDVLLSGAGATKVDVIKIDVDGFDGKVLSGASDTLRSQKPSVIFEWHPILLRRTGNDPLLPFKVLTECDYSTFVWFDKYGVFSHFMVGLEEASLTLIEKLCSESKVYDDRHYDVVALHQDAQITPLDMAELSYATKRKSPY